ncbi:hypothetical protein BU26DRAFT_159579 [Trematosphaeria pertusa]|uniref:Uncharacterized protein n=1 Tax=Trematosphaeria pertusa TaxID=390896 RepID=A0A6A6HYC9_9PLEO|nr:uncharacterized protein BU26DRAFT_159579 [Trematosphaeria pertusa]KAF2242370.1 hypothetical protein BU26DRAFT_159579 [Trematosphaeria pertusa]
MASVVTALILNPHVPPSSVERCSRRTSADDGETAEQRDALRNLSTTSHTLRHMLQSISSVLVSLGTCYVCITLYFRQRVRHVAMAWPPCFAASLLCGCEQLIGACYCMQELSHCLAMAPNPSGTVESLRLCERRLIRPSTYSLADDELVQH